MTRTIRLLLRASTLVVLAALLAGVPWLVIRATGWPPVELDDLRSALDGRHLDDRAVLRVGGAVFSALWLWFAATALAEATHLLRWRLGRSRHRLAPIAAGPGGWVRSMVRFVAVSSVTAGTTFASVTAPSVGAAPPLGATAVGTTHVVVAGDTYWDIATDHLAERRGSEPTPREVLDYTNELVEFNRDLLGHHDPTLIVPGELVVLTPVDLAGDATGPAVVAPAAAAPPRAPSAAPDPTAPATSVAPVASVAPVTPATSVAPATQVVEPPSAEQPSTAVAFAAGLGTALMLSAGGVSLLEARRRQQLRAANVGARLAPPTPAMVRTERTMRETSAAERLARLDLALRVAGTDLAAQRAVLTAALVDDHGEVRLHLRGAAVPTDPRWHVDLHAGTWRLPAEVPIAALADGAMRAPQPCPAMVHLGRVPECGELFVDLEALGVLAVDSPHARDILRCLTASLAVSPFIEASRVFTVDLGEVSLGAGNSEPLDTLDSALDAAAMVLGSTLSLSRGTTTFALRAGTAEGGESWEPAIVVAAAARSADPDRATAALGDVAPGSGLAVVVDAPGSAEWVLRFDPDRGDHVLEPLGVRLHPTGLSAGDVRAVTDLLDAAEQVPVAEADVVPIDVRSRPPQPFAETEWSLMVRVLGHVGVVARNGATVDFDRSKALELVVWLSQHRERPTRTGARTALWDLDVRDATFANVVSEARRAMARVLAPGDGEEWLARTLTEDLPLHAHVVTDAELLAARVAHARHLPPGEAIELIRPGLEFVTGMPFAGTSYLWTDAEGITSSLVLLATSAAIQVASHYLTIGDVDGVFWATGQGLKVLSGHEELIALRMRAHAQRGDLGGVRGEWESYERALAADPWAATEPAPKLLALRRELLSPATVGSVQLGSTSA